MLKERQNMEALIKPETNKERTKDKMASDLECKLMPSLRPWASEQVKKLWREQYETSRKSYLKKLSGDHQTLSEDQLVSNLKWFLNDKEVSEPEALQLFQYWVETVLSHVYRSAFTENLESERHIGVLWSCLNDSFMPGEETAYSLASDSRLPLEKATSFLVALRSAIRREGNSCTLPSLGWLIQEKGRPFLILCWDEIIPQARYLKDWGQSHGAEILEKQDDVLYLLLDVSSNDLSRNISYTIQGLEAEGLEEGDRVRYWQDYSGQPFVFAEGYLSPYFEQRMAEWTGIDDRVYDSDPLPAG